MKQISDDEVNCTRKYILATRIQIKVCNFPLIRYNTTQQTIILLQKKTITSIKVHLFIPSS
jgi:hypothetical protein